MDKLIRIAITLGVLGAAPAAGAADLLEVYRNALKNDPQIREAEANREAAMEARPQAIAELLPQVTASAAKRNTDSEGTRSFFTGGQLVPVDTKTDTNTNLWSIELTQTIFDWNDFQQLAQSHHEVAQAEADYQAALDDLIVRVARRYFDVLSARAELEAARADKAAFTRQLEQAQRRHEVGMIAITGVQEARAAHDRAVADEIDAERNLSVAREALREITGRYPERLEPPREELPLARPEPTDPDAWAERAMEQNLAISAAKLQVDIADRAVSRQRAGRLPQIEAFASRTRTDASSDNVFVDDVRGREEFPSINQTEDDVIGVRATISLFSGGAVTSQIREAAHNASAARHRLKRIQRESVNAARDAYLNVISEISRIEALRQSVRSSRTALDATTAGFEVGTRTTVDVLNARRDLSRAETQLALSKHSYIVSVLRLKEAAGTLEAEDVAAANGLLEGGAEHTPEGVPDWP